MKYAIVCKISVTYNFFFVKPDFIFNTSINFLTKANNGKLCFSYHGEIYTMNPGEQPEKVNLTISFDGRQTLDKIVKVNKGFTETSLSSNGKEFVYVFRGEIFVSSVGHGTTKRITNTPWQERSVTFSPDGRSILVRQGIIRARYRNSLDTQELLEPGKISKCIIEIDDLVDAETEAGKQGSDLLLISVGDSFGYGIKEALYPQISFNHPKDSFNALTGFLFLLGKKELYLCHCQEGPEESNICPLPDIENES